MPSVPTQLDRAMTSGGEAGALVRGFDWSSTPLGPMSSWGMKLQTLVSTCLATGFPMVVNWGPDLIQIYNEAAIGVYGNKHPAAMGRSARTNFPEFWEFSTVEAIVQSIFATALPFRAEDQRVSLRRNGLLQEAYFTFSLSPILDQDGTVLAILNTYVETTGRVLGERRMATLRGLAERAVKAREATEACAEALAALSTNPYDLRFVLLYLSERDGASARLAGTTGIAAGGPATPRTLARSGAQGFAWPLDAVLTTRQPVLVEDLPSKVDLGSRPGRTSPPRDALVLPLMRSRDAAPAGILVVGLSPRLPFDDGYRGFLQLVAAQIAAGIASAEAYEEASQRAERLAEIDRAKSVFYGNISHEFRTPLTLLLGPVEDMLREDPGRLDAADRERLLAIRRNAERLLRLVSALLDLARVEARSLALQGETTDLAGLTREIAAEFTHAMTSAGLRFVIECPPLPCDVRVDRSVWETIVLNLLSNALKYTPSGSVTVSLHAIDGRVRLVVADTGVGIPPAALPHVFERFYRAREAGARSIEGTGLGLALVREFVRALGGEVRVESAPGAGSTFTAEIPMDGAPHVELPPVPAPEVEQEPASAAARSVVQEAESWVKERKPAQRPSREGEAPVARSRVLVVEDNADMRQYVAHLLSGDYQVETAADGVAALRMATESPPDLVLSDVLMPGLDGLALVRALRQNPATRSVPALLLTARAGEDAALEGLGSGADDYIVKPFSSRELRARVATHLQLARVRRDAAESAMKDAFIGVASHELRTPLTSMKLQLELLGRDAGQSKGAPRLDALGRGVARMEGLVDDLLSMSAITAGTFAMHRERGDLGTICRAAAEEQMRIAQRRVSIDVPHEPTVALVDPRRVEQAVGSIIANAMKYSSPDTPVALELRQTEGEAVIQVHDEGPGIPAEALPHLFERFYRVPGLEPRGDSRIGLGLGLFIAREIVQGHGGHIDVASAPGHGSTFSVHLPLAQGDAARRSA
jgi:signal transduction histidine kinase